MLIIGEGDLGPPGLGRDPPLPGFLFGEGRRGGIGEMSGSGELNPGLGHLLFGEGGCGISDPRYVHHPGRCKSNCLIH